MPEAEQSEGRKPDPSKFLAALAAEEICEGARPNNRIVHINPFFERGYFSLKVMKRTINSDYFIFCGIV